MLVALQVAAENKVSIWPAHSPGRIKSQPASVSAECWLTLPTPFDRTTLRSSQVVDKRVPARLKTAGGQSGFADALWLVAAGHIGTSEG